MAFEFIVIGVSTGGPKALAAFLPALCDLVDLPVLIVQHIPDNFPGSLCNSLSLHCKRRIINAGDGVEIHEKIVYLAPPGKHLKVGKGFGNVPITRLSSEEKVNYCRPSVDVLFFSMAKIFPGKALGVILTGMGNDGTEGARLLKSTGSLILVQDEDSSVVWGMPGSVVRAGLADAILPLMDLPFRIRSILMNVVTSSLPELIPPQKQ